MGNPGEAAERFIVAEGLYHIPTPQRQQLLGCIACCWDRKVAADEYPEYTNGDLATCAKLGVSSVGQLSAALQAAGLVVGRTANAGLSDTRNGGQYIHFSPVDNTPEGRAFQDSLEAPPDCPLA